MGWTTSRGQRRLDPVLAGFHHAINPVLDDNALRMELACARACAGYPFQANQDNCDPPNRADQVNAAQANWTSHVISRGVTLKVPYPFGFTPHRAQHVEPATGQVSGLVVVPAANAMRWEEGCSLFGTGGFGGGALWGWPSTEGAALSSDFHVWTFAHDVSGLARVDLMVREDADGQLPVLATADGATLWGKAEGGRLYLATDAPSTLAGRDIFLMLRGDPGPPWRG